MATKGSLDNGIFIHLTQKMVGVRRKVDMKHLEVKGDSSVEGEKVDKKLLNASKNILECEEYDAIVQGQAETRDFLRARCIWAPWYKKGYYFAPFANATEILDGIKERQAKEERAVEAFISVLPRVKAESKRRLKHLYVESNYPTERRIREGISTDFEIRDEVVPKRLEKLGEKVLKAELKKSEAEAAELVREFKYDLRRQLQELVAHLADRLAPDAQGDRKVFRTSAIDNISEWLKFFGDKNTVAGDADLRELAASLKKQLEGVDVEQLKDDAQYRKQLEQSMSAAKSSLDGLLKDMPKRLIADRDEEV